MSRYAPAQFVADFPDDAACLAAVLRLVHGGPDIWCPGCMQRSRFHPIRRRRAFACQACGHHLFPCADTIFAGSRTPLRVWFRAIYLTTGMRRGLRPVELRRELGVTYKTAWRMARLLRRLTASGDYRGALAGFGPRSSDLTAGPSGR